MPFTLLVFVDDSLTLTEHVALPDMYANEISVGVVDNDPITIYVEYT